LGEERHAAARGRLGVGRAMECGGGQSGTRGTAGGAWAVTAGASGAGEGGVRRRVVLMTARPIPVRHWRSYGHEPLPTSREALDEPFSAFPSWFMRITCDRCGKIQMVNETHTPQDDMLIRDIIARLRHDGCGGRAGKVELLTGIEGSCWSVAKLCRHHRNAADDDGDGRPLSDGKLLIVFVIAAVLVAAIIALVLWLSPQL
jgi:hypothetical protein